MEPEQRIIALAQERTKLLRAVAANDRRMTEAVNSLKLKRLGKSY